MPRDMSAAFEAALDGPIIYPAYFYTIELKTTVLRLWTGKPGLSYVAMGQTWTGVGQLISTTGMEEASDLKATSLTIELQADAAMISGALLEVKKNRTLDIHLGLFSPSNTTVLIADPILIYSGLCDICNINFNVDRPSISIRYESHIADMERPRVRRSTHEDQQIEHPGDMFYSHVGALSDMPLPWGFDGTSL